MKRLVVASLIWLGLCISALAQTTWNPSDKSAGTTLSGGNLVASMAAGGDGVRSTTSKTTGKTAFSISGDWTTFNLEINLTISSSDYFGSTPPSVELLWDSTNSGQWELYPNTGTPSVDVSHAPSGTNTVILYIDQPNELVYASVDGNYLFGGNPGAGTGGISVSGISTATIFATTVNTGFGGSVTGTANFSPTSLPSGWSAWDGGAPPATPHLRSLTGVGK